MEHVLFVSLRITSMMKAHALCVMVMIYVVLAEARDLMLNTARLAIMTSLNVLNVSLDSTRTLMVLVSSAIFLTVLNVE
jgi:hypothetical protein